MAIQQWYDEDKEPPGYHEVTLDHPFPVQTELTKEGFVVKVGSEAFDRFIDVMERIQDQLALITGVNLSEGERYR